MIWLLLFLVIFLAVVFGIRTAAGMERQRARRTERPEEFAAQQAAHWRAAMIICLGAGVLYAALKIFQLALSNF